MMDRSRWSCGRRRSLTATNGWSVSNRQGEGFSQWTVLSLSITLHPPRFPSLSFSFPFFPPLFPSPLPLLMIFLVQFRSVCPASFLSVAKQGGMGKWDEKEVCVWDSGLLYMVYLSVCCSLRCSNCVLTLPSTTSPPPPPHMFTICFWYVCVVLEGEGACICLCACTLLGAFHI